MAYENLKAAIKQAIKQNDNQEITGDLLQSTLLSIVDAMIEVVQESGVAEDKVMSQKAVSNLFITLQKDTQFSSVAGENAILYNFKKGEEYLIDVQCDSIAEPFGLYTKIEGTLVDNFGTKTNEKSWTERFVASSDADKLIVYVNRGVKIYYSISEIAKPQIADLYKSCVEIYSFNGIKDNVISASKWTQNSNSIFLQSTSKPFADGAVAKKCCNSP